MLNFVRSLKKSDVASLNEDENLWKLKTICIKNVSFNYDLVRDEIRDLDQIMSDKCACLRTVTDYEGNEKEECKSASLFDK